MTPRNVLLVDDEEVRGRALGEVAVFVDARGVAALFHSETGFAGALAERALARQATARVTISPASGGLLHGVPM